MSYEIFSPRPLCIGAAPDPHAALAIRRFGLLHNEDGGDSDWRKLHIASRELGCPSCGKFNKFEGHYCRRCYRLNAAINKIDKELSSLLPRMFRKAKRAEKRRLRFVSCLMRKYQEACRDVQSASSQIQDARDRMKVFGDVLAIEGVDLNGIVP